MGKYSRTAKYEELRNQLQNDAEGQIETKDLSKFANRLNKIDSSSFDSMSVNDSGMDSANRVRKDPINENLDQNAEVEHTGGVEEITTFDNEYLDEYINEVKQYNKEKGRITTDDTQINILHELRGNPKPSKLVDIDELNVNKSTVEFKPKKELSIEPSFDETTSIPFMNDTMMNTQISMELSKMLGGEMAIEGEEKEPDDFQKLILPFNIEERFEEEKTARKQIVDETAKMKVQLNQYQGNLSEVQEKVAHSNRILNFILVVLILALVVVICIIGYWMLLNRGVI